MPGLREHLEPHLWPSYDRLLRVVVRAAMAHWDKLTPEEQERARAEYQAEQQGGKAA